MEQSAREIIWGQEIEDYHKAEKFGTIVFRDKEETVEEDRRSQDLLFVPDPMLVPDFSGKSLGGDQSTQYLYSNFS